jgi:hypothetical protein
MFGLQPEPSTSHGACVYDCTQVSHALLLPLLLLLLPLDQR